MKIIEPEVKFVSCKSPLEQVEFVGRVCTNSYDKMTVNSALPFCQMLYNRKHGTPFEHTRVKVPNSLYCECLYSKSSGDMPGDIYGFLYRARNFLENHIMTGRDFLAIGGTIEELAKLTESDDYATLQFTIDIGISRELCRHRQMSFMERSTRYVNLKDGIEFIRPMPFEWAKDETDLRFCSWKNSCLTAEIHYSIMSSNGCAAQESRSVLPLSTRTELFMTGTYKQWNEVFALRLDKAAHPSMRYIMEQARELIKENL